MSWTIKSHRLAVTGTVLAAVFCGADPSFSADDPKAEIRAALERWRDDFNARRADQICDLFASDLRYDFQGLPEQNYERLCNRLHGALGDPAMSIRYGLIIKEILVSGDLAVARLTWTETSLGKDGKPVTHDEPGLDVFGRQSDRGWKIIRYIAYAAAPG
jgi:ketosteroid isomerase-like protein